ncbi:MAG: phage tail protein [Alphaproteobacteria bacterium]|nr:phage tail protein [Alphaproteobacteria bacterium]
MLPLLYPKNTKKEDFFTSNGLGFFDKCLKCVVTEERNAAYELEAEILKNDRLAKSVAPGTFIKVRANAKDDPQVFEIYQVTTDEIKIKINAQHVKYFLNYNSTTEPFYDETGTPTELWAELQRYLAVDNPFEFYTDINSTHTILSNVEINLSAGEILAGVRGSFLDIFGGELHFDNFTVNFLQNRGEQTGVCLRYGSNISSTEQTVDNITVYSHILPYAYVYSKMEGDDWNIEQMYLSRLSGAIDITSGANFEYKKVLMLDLTDQMQDVVVEWYDNPPIPKSSSLSAAIERLNAEAVEYLNRYTNELKYPSTSIKIDTTETLNGLQELGLCDSIYIIINGEKTTAKITKCVYDSLAEKYTEMEIGKQKKDLSNVINITNMGAV